jgi:hypothetical protein
MGCVKVVEPWLDGRLLPLLLAQMSWMSWMEIEPSPTAEATRLIDP